MLAAAVAARQQQEQEQRQQEAGEGAVKGSGRGSGRARSQRSPAKVRLAGPKDVDACRLQVGWWTPCPQRVWAWATNIACNGKLPVRSVGIMSR